MSTARGKQEVKNPASGRSEDGKSKTQDFEIQKEQTQNALEGHQSGHVGMFPLSSA
jgi:hypothetical protein